MNYIGVDVGGTKIYAARYSTDFEILDSIKIKTDAQSGSDIVIKHCIEVIGALTNKETQGIGIAWAGMVHSDKKNINLSPNIKGFENIPLGQIIEEWFNLPVLIENDARCFALGEQQINFPLTNNFLGIIIGTGVASGLILEGRTIGGFQNAAGEIGHQILGKKTPEELFSGPALEKLFQKPLNQVIEYPKEKIEKKLRKRIELFADWLFNNILAINPQIICFGGWAGIHFWPIFFEEISQRIDQSNQAKNILKIKYCLSISCLENAGALGAAILIKKATH